MEGVSEFPVITPIGSEWATRYPDLIGFDHDLRTPVGCPVCGSPTTSCTHPAQETLMARPAKKAAAKSDTPATAAEKAKEQPTNESAAADEAAKAKAADEKAAKAKAAAKDASDLPEGLHAVDGNDELLVATKDITVSFVPRGTQRPSTVLLVAAGGTITRAALASRKDAYAGAEGYEVK